MTSAAALAFPDSRTLASWWRVLASHHPRRWWVGHLLFHRVEALVRVARPLPPLVAPVLGAVALWQDARDLDRHLHLDPQLLRRILHGLVQRGLAQTTGPEQWALTERGRQALQPAGTVEHHCERRLFHFLDCGHRPPWFIHLGDHAGQACQAANGWTFDPACLEACARQPATWKRQHGFPSDIDAVVLTGSGTMDEDANTPEWQRIVVDQPERLFTVLLEAAGSAGSGLVAFEVRAERWSLQAGTPVFSLPSDWPEALPALAPEPPLSVWLDAWREWCRSRGLMDPEVEHCRLDYQGHRLRVRAPASLLHRLRSLRSEALRGEAWLLAGDGPVRPAAQLEVTDGAG